MFRGSNVFTYLSKKNGVSKDNVQYVALNVVTKDVNKARISFLITDEKLMNELNNKQFHDYQDIKLIFNVSRVFNKETRYSHWEVEVIGVE